MAEPRIRRAAREDAETLAALEARAAAFPWSDRQYRASLADHRCWVVELDGAVVGCLIYSAVLDEVELLNLVVDPAQQGRGLGRTLMGVLLDNNRASAQKIFLEVRLSNAPAIHLYESLGFRECGRRKNYYPALDGAREDALVMEYRYE